METLLVLGMYREGGVSLFNEERGVIIRNRDVVDIAFRLSIFRLNCSFFSLVLNAFLLSYCPCIIVTYPCLVVSFFHSFVGLSDAYCSGIIFFIILLSCHHSQKEESKNKLRIGS